MIFFLIPARNDLPNYQFRITLSSQIFTLYFHYNVRMERWILDLEDSSGNIILAGVALLILRDLVGQYVTLALPQGLMFATDDTQKGTQPTLLSFGTDHTFWYGDPTL